MPIFVRWTVRAADRMRVDTVLEEIDGALDRGLLPGRFFSDPTVFELEIERLFGRAWLYVGHETEIPNPGDYVTRNLARDSVLFVRGKDGQSRVLLNVCRHRGARVCRTERGNSSSFRCPYHGWTYSNTGELLGVPAFKEAYGERLDRTAWGLLPLPKVERYDGLVFATCDPDGPSLGEYLGGMTWYLDLVTKRTEAGLEVVGTPHRWVVNANWKYPADNFVGDSYHTLNAHESAAEAGLLARRVELAQSGVTVWAVVDGGHSARCKWNAEGGSTLEGRGYPEAYVETLNHELAKPNLLPEQAEAFVQSSSMGGYIFPNLAYFNPVQTAEQGGAAVGFISLRVWQPIAPDRTEICSWHLVERDAPEEYKRASYLAYMRSFGAGGNVEQDDVELWRSATESTKGFLGGNLLQNITMDIGEPQLATDFPGPGQAYTVAYTERPQRAFYRRCLQYLTGKA